MVRHVKKDFMEKLNLWGRKYRYPALILALGVLLLLLPTGKDSEEGPTVLETAPQRVSSGEFDLDAFTAQTEAILSGISGAGQVRLLLTLDTDGVSTYLSDETSRQDGEEQERENQTVLVKQGSNEAALTVTKEFPTFRGAVVLCQGAQDPKVTLGIKEAISSLTGLGMDKITVLKMD